MAIRRVSDKILHRGVSRDYHAPKGKQWCVTYEYRDGYHIIGRFATKAEAFAHLERMKGQ